MMLGQSLDGSLSQEKLVRLTIVSLRNLSHRCATPAKSAWGTALALIAVALLATPTQAATIVFFDDFQSDTVGNTPVIGSGDTGTSWSNEVAPGVEVVSNLHMTGNTSTQVLQPYNKGEMDGNFSTGIALSGSARSRRISTLHLTRRSIKLQ